MYCTPLGWTMCHKVWGYLPATSLGLFGLVAVLAVLAQDLC